MSDYGKLAGGSGVVVGAYEIFFVDERSARICAQKYAGNLQRLDDGWLVTVPRRSASDDDPIIQIIKRAIAEAEPN